MATETVIYVSLALVLLTRIYVFISPPEFLEQHKDRRYHEYHLYRQYHIRKQIDDGDDKDEQPPEDDDLAELLHSHSRRRSSSSAHQPEQHGYSDGGFVDPSPLTALHYPSDELVLLGMGPGARPLPLGDLSAAGFSKLENLAVNTTTSLSIDSSLSTTASTVAAATATTPTTATATGSSSSSPYSPRYGGEQGVWKNIMGASETGSVPSYLSLDTSEIHYNGSLQRFEKDSEVLESITALKAGQRDMAKECPVMTVVWEGGRWCCLEGRTLYILRALEWRGQVRVRVLVDKDPTTLAVTEECWKAAGMTSDLTPLFTTLGRKPSVSTTPTSAVFESALTVTEEEDVLRGKGSRAFMSTATADPNATTIGLSLEDDSTFGGRILIGTPEVEANVRFSSLSNSSSKRSSLSGSHSGNDADVEEDVESRPASDDGYLEDDEGETEEDEGSFSEDDQDHVRSRLQAMSLYQHSSTATVTPQRRQQQQRRMLQPLTVHQDESENNSDLTMVSPPSPLFTPLSTIQSPSDRIRKLSFESTTLPGGDVVHPPRAVSSSQHHHHQHQCLRQHHERKISIPEFMLPPPLHDERVYLIVDPSRTVGGVAKEEEEEEEEAARLLREKNPPRRDSGHGDSP